MPIDFLNFRSIAVFICILQGVIFAGLLIVRGIRQGSKADVWLAALLLVLSASLITPFIGFANVYDNNQWLTYFPFTIAYSQGVLVWLYTANLTDSRRSFTRRDLAYFIPAAAYLSFRLFLFAQSIEWKSAFDGTYVAVAAPVIFVTETLWNLSFLGISIFHYRKYRAWLDQNYSDTEKIKFDWLRNFLYVFTAVTLVGAAFDFVDSFLFKLSYIQYFYFELVLAFATYCLAIAGYLRSRSIEVSFSQDEEEESADRRQLLSTEELERQKAKIERIITDERPHLEPSLTLADLSRIAGVNTTVLSHIINQGFGQNFNDFINSRRIDEVKKSLADGSDATLTAIAFDCGFNSKATFNRAFRKLTGQSPTEYQEAQTRLKSK